VDFRRLNSSTVADPYYIATLGEILERMDQSKIVSKFDLAKGFYQIPVAESENSLYHSIWDICLQVNIPFSLENAPAVFQHTMEEVLGHIYNCALYIDDLIVFSTTWEEHLSDFKKLLNALRARGLTVKESKRALGMR